jgi:hypothetical protein
VWHHPPGAPRPDGVKIKVFAVRSGLSRYLASGGDCVVVIIPPLKCEKDGLPVKIREVIVKYVNELNIKQKKKMVFIVRYFKDDADRVRDELFQLAEKLGFESSVVQSRYVRVR